MTEDEYRKRWANTIPSEFSGTRGAIARNQGGKVTASTSLSIGDFERFKALAFSQDRTPSVLLLVLVREFLGGTQFLSEIALSEPINALTSCGRWDLAKKMPYLSMLLHQRAASGP